MSRGIQLSNPELSVIPGLQTVKLDIILEYLNSDFQFEENNNCFIKLIILIAYLIISF